MRVRFTRGAATQIDGVLGYIQARSPQGADSVRERLLAVIDMLRLQPQAGHPTSRPGVMRIVLVPYPYFLDYRVTGGEIVIQRCRHTARRAER